MVEFPVNKEFPDITIQKSQIEERLKEPMTVGQTWYIISAKWFKTFKYFVGIENSERAANAINPGPIDNSLLLGGYLGTDEAHEEVTAFYGFEDFSTAKRNLFNFFQYSGEIKFPVSLDIDSNLKIGLVEGLDYVVIPPSAWASLLSWYGLKDNQSPIERQVINIARPPRVESKVEVYKIELNLFNNCDFKNPFPYLFSQAEKIKNIEDVCRNVYKIPSDLPVQLRCFYGPNQSQILNKDHTIYDESLNSDLKIVVEGEEACSKNFMRPALPKNREPSRIPRVSANNNRGAVGPGVLTRGHAAITYSVGSAEGRGLPCTPGLSGLMNLGNTCFLNSIIQCLSNCGPVTQYFLDGNYINEINATNPLGKAGQIASSFADVISMMWSGKHSTTVPHYFKLQLTKFAPQFAGCQQHDAQELLTFLLDGLHEDLNRIKDKPYFQSEENDQEDDALAQQSWEYFLQRNNSIIIDHFHGMLKSRVVCPDCEKVSIKFDTFSTLSLPMPLRCDRVMRVRYVPYDQMLQVKEFQIIVPKKGIIRDMATELSKITEVRPEHMVIAEISKSHFHKFFSMDDPIECIDDREKIFMYDLPVELVEDKVTKHTILPVVLWEFHEPTQSTHFLSSLFGTPFLMLLPRGKLCFKTLYDKICERLIRSCEGFLKANKNYGCFPMDLDPAEDDTVNTKSTNHYLFTPVLVNTYCYENVKKIMDNEQDTFEVPDSFGRELLALQVQRQVRLDHYKDPPVTYEDHSSGSRPTPKPTLEDCLTLFTTNEKLGENNAWHCPRCNMKKRATKKLDLWRLPNILIFHLKRFAFNETRKEKLDTKVEFPLTDLNIDHYVVNKHKENLIYDLIGVCNHYGSLMGGHYTAMCKSYHDGNWYCFDDNSVSPVSPKAVQTESAYVLFYQRRPVTQAKLKQEKPHQ